MPSDFSGQNLQGRNFQGQDLSGCNFSQADLRGANFSQAILRNANLIGIKAGLSQQWQVGHFLLGCLSVIGCSSIAVLLNSFLLNYFWQPEFMQTATWMPGVFIFLLTVALAMVVSTQGLTIQTTYIASCTIAIGIALLIVLSGTAPHAGALSLANFLLRAACSSIAILIAGVIPNAISITYASMTTLSLFSATAIAIAAGSLTFVFSLHLAGLSQPLLISSNCTMIAFSGYIAWQSLQGNEAFNKARELSFRLATRGGTCFCGSDLTEANFSSACLRNTNFAPQGQRPTTLTRVLWSSSQQLEYAYFASCPLTHPTIRKLVVSRNGYKGTFWGLDLRGINLNGANLNQANLKRTNLTGASLRRADLRQADLTGSLAIGTDFTDAQFAGARLDNWAIDSTTKLNVTAHFPSEPQKLMQTNNQRRSVGEPDSTLASLVKPSDEMLLVQSASNPMLNGQLSEQPSPHHSRSDNQLPAQPASPDPLEQVTRTQAEQVGLQIHLATLSGELEELYRKIINFAQNLRQLPVHRGEQEPPLTLESLIQQLGPQNLLGLYEERLQRVEARLERLESSRVSDMKEVLLTVMRQLSMQPVARRPKIGVLLSRLYQGIKESQDLSSAEKAVLLEQVKALAGAKQASDSDKKAAMLQKAERLFQAILQNYPETSNIAKLCNKLIPLIWKAIEAQ